MNHEREEALFNEFLGQNEFQNAFAVSCIRSPQGQERESQELVKAGRFVVCSEHEIFCPATDAFIRMALHIHSHHSTRDAAVAAAESLNGDADPSNGWVFVLPQRLEPLPEVSPAFGSEEIPF